VGERVPARARISETLLRFASPLLDGLGREVIGRRGRLALKTAITAWNSAVFADAFGNRRFLEEARQRLAGDPDAAGWFEAMVARKRVLFGDDERLIGAWKFVRTPAGVRLRAEARHPGASPKGGRDRKGGVLEIEVTLRHVQPRVWRRIRVRGGTTLGELHHVIQAAMGWDEEHLHKFVAGDRSYGPRDMSREPIGENENRITVSDALPRRRSRILYEYDFGDGWEHDIVLEDVLPEAGTERTPMVIDGARACPPEDCGGFAGYARMLAILRDPKHPEHEDMLEGCGGEFDPEAFEVSAANRRLWGEEEDEDEPE